MTNVIFEEKETVDRDTGEIIRESTTVSRIKSNEPDYVKLYIKAWCDFKEIKGINTSFLYQLLPYMTYATESQLLILSSYVKEEIAKTLGWSLNTYQQRFSRELKKLVKAGVISHIKTSTYQVNPELIGKGEWKDIRNLRATFNLSNGEVTHKYENSKEGEE